MPLPSRSLVRSVISVMRSVERRRPGWGLGPMPWEEAWQTPEHPPGLCSSASPVNSFLQRSRTLLSRFSSWIWTFL